VGYTGSDGTNCAACLADSYKSSVGSASCTSCVAGSTTSGGTAKTASTDCKCDLGYTGIDGGPCSTCVINTYKATTGSAACTACSSLSNTQGQRGSTSQSRCVCNPGYTGADGGTNCQPCAIDTWKSVSGSTPCTSCPTASITLGLTARTLITECKCSAGYTGNDGNPCGSCSADTYKTLNGSSSCLSCPSNSSTNALTARTLPVQCGCRVGLYGPSGGPCSPCLADTYNDDFNQTTCTTCPSGSTTNNLVMRTVITACVCARGYTGSNGGPCSGCTANTYKPAVGSATCTACPGFSTTNGATAQLTIASCRCPAGYTGADSSACTPCAINTYKTDWSSNTCTICPSNSQTASTASPSLSSCQCSPGYTGSNGGPCTACDIGKYKSSPGSSSCTTCPSGATTSTAGATSLSACMCDLGYTGDGQSACTACGSNTYKDTIGSSLCQQCRTNSSSSTASSFCQCVAGYEGTNVNAPCTACSYGYYKPTTSNTMCTSCPSFTNTSSLASDALTKCTCNIGYTGNDGTQCSPCSVNTYKSVTGSSSCTSCPTNQNTQGATGVCNINACVCNPGYTGDDGVSCSACPSDTYKVLNGSSICLACPSNSSAPSISTAITDCICDAGFDGVAGGPCVDHNECIDNNGGCIGPCINTVGSSICGAFIVTDSLTLLQGGTWSSNVLTLDNIDGGDMLSVLVSLQNLTTDQITLVYGDPDSLAGEYPCKSTIWATDPSGYMMANCTTSSGVGSELGFALRYCYELGCYRVAANSTTTFRYPPPSITDGTLSNDARETQGAIIAAVNNLGETVSFDGAGFTKDITRMIVYLGPVGQVDQYRCTLQTKTTATRIWCRTPTGGAGQGLVFTVSVGGTNVTGHDSYSYPVVPEIGQVTGCDTGVTNCPTIGGSIITIYGTGFLPPLSAFINGESCFVMDNATITQFQCSLPSGTGVDQSLVVSGGVQFSSSVKAVSYAGPNITGLACSACTVKSGMALSGCPRTAGTLGIFLTIYGANFGPRAPLILVGESQCAVDTSSMVTTQTQLRCYLPSGNRLDRPVLLLQSGGQLSSSPATLSYTQCTKGTYEVGLTCLSCNNGSYAEAESQTTCTDCLAGRYSQQASYSCLDCGAGTYSLSGSPNCTQCPLGRFVSTGGQSTCGACDSGTYASVTGLSRCASCEAGQYSVKTITSQLGEIGSTECLPCPSGSYTAVSAQASCVQCDAGTYANATGASVCTACDRGTYSTKNSTSGSGATVCTACSIGMANSVTGQQTCTACDSGTYSNTTGNSACAQCITGRYSVKNTTSGAIYGGGATRCARCSAGTYADTEGTSECKPCPSGQFSGSMAVTCTRCPAGSQQASTGQNDCDACNLGKYSGTDAQALCVEWYVRA
jgi:hypothetical protein